MQTLQVGDSCPKIKLLSHQGEWVDLCELSMKHTIVLFFYPKDFTAGCTKEACSFRDNFEDFESQNAKIFGISMDNSASHSRFATKHQLNYPLLSDKDKSAQKAFGVPAKLFGLITGRVTFVIQNGQIKGVFDSLTDPIFHTAKSLELVKQLNHSI